MNWSPSEDEAIWDMFSDEQRSEILKCQSESNTIRLREIIASVPLKDLKLHRHPLHLVQRAFQSVREKNVNEKTAANQFHKTDSVDMSKEEVELLLELAQNRHINDINWQAVARNFKDRKSSQLRARYMYLMPHITKGPWTIEEDLKVLIGYKVFGRNWTKI